MPNSNQGKNDNKGSGVSGRTQRGGTSEQHTEAARQSHKNDDKKSGSTSSGGNR